MFWSVLTLYPGTVMLADISKDSLSQDSLSTGAPKLINIDLFLEKRATVFIGTVARFSRNKSLLISFGAPVV